MGSRLTKRGGNRGYFPRAPKLLRAPIMLLGPGDETIYTLYM